MQTHQTLFLLLVITQTLLHGWYANASPVTKLRFLLLADTQLTSTDTYIQNSLLGVLENQNFNYILISGGLINNPNSNNPTSQISNLLQKFQILGKVIYWIPSPQEIVGAPENVTNLDQNIHQTYVQPVPGLYIVGYGGNYTTSEIQNFYQNQPFETVTDASVILMTYFGPAGFDTTTIRINSAYDGTTGIYGMTTFLNTVQSNLILNVHGGNPQGIGSSSFGDIRILNPGGARNFNSFSIFDVILNGNNRWVLSDWKFYRYGNVTSWGGVTNTDSCKTVTTTVAAPWQPSPYTVAAIVLFSFFLVAYVVGFTVFVHVGKAE